MQKQETILFCPLNWGLGHATRIVILIKKEQKKDNKIIIAASGGALQFLKQEFPDLQYVYLPDFSVRYWQKPFFNLGLFIQMALFFVHILVEHIRVKSIINKYGVTKIVSDNRYGLFSSKTRNVIITHQLFIKVPRVFKISEPIIHIITRKLINFFDECWIPDYSDFDKSLSKELSHGKKMPKNVKYINPLSRFINFNLNEQQKYFADKYPDVLVLISGPEPSRTIFEKQIEKRFANSQEYVLMVCGVPNDYLKECVGNIKKVNHLSTNELFFYIKNSKKIISRSGYSTLMDLHVLERKAELSATPGQTEQEYLYFINSD